MGASTAAQLELRSTTARDGAGIAALVRATGALEPATEYAYVMLADLFGETCVIASVGGQPIGCVLGFRVPQRPDTLFVWQIGVHPSARRCGIAHAMLAAILERPSQPSLRAIEATVAPSNAASEAMFYAFAAQRGAQVDLLEGYPASVFAAAHEPEPLIRITGV